MSIASEITRLQNAKDSIKTAIENKGVTVGSGTLDTYANKINDIPTGSGEWKPQPDWWDIDTILDEDTENYPGKVIVLTTDTYPSEWINTNMYTTRCAKIKTSDGVEYDVTNQGGFTHNWDITKDKPCSLGYKTRYFIMYYDTTDFDMKRPGTNAMWQALYIVCKGINLIASTEGVNHISSMSLLECIKFIDGAWTPQCLSLDKTYSLRKIIGLNTSQITNLTYFSDNYGLCSYKNFWDDYQIDTKNITNFNKAFSNTTFTYIPSLDFNSATNVSNVFGGNTLITINEVKNIKISGINLSGPQKLNHDTLIRFLNALYDYSDSSDSYTITFGSENLKKLTDEEKAIATSKGWTLN